jgi:hypothetical protein
MRNLSKTLWLAAACLWPLSAQAQSACSNSTLNGTYFYVLSGNVFSSAQQSFVPYAELGKFTADGNGGISGQATASVNFAIGAVSLSGSYAVQGNCTGTIALNTIGLTIQIISGGQSAIFVSSSANVVITGQAYRAASTGGAQCGKGSLNGGYGYVLSGAIVDSSGEFYYSEAGQVTADGNGNLTDTNVYNLGGGGNSDSGSGTYTINSDCTGTAQLIYPDGTFNYDIALGKDNHLLLLEADAGAGVAGTGQRQSIGAILPQFAFGGGWYSALYFTNSNSNSVSFTVNFTADGGSPLTVPSLGGSSVTVTIQPNGTAVLEAPNTGALSQGYASVALPAGVTGNGIFRQSVAGQPNQEAVVPLVAATSTTSTLTWDETGGAVIAVAIVNPSAVATNVSITVWDANGNLIGTSAPVSLQPNSKTTATLDSLVSGMKGQRGSAQFTVSTGNVSVLGLRFVGGGAFTSIPATGN